MKSADLELAAELYDESAGLYAAHEYEPALEKLELALEIYERSAPGSLDTVQVLMPMADICRILGELDSALDYSDRALEICERIAPGTEQYAHALAGLGVVHRSRGDLSAALDHYQRALAILEVVAPQSPATASMLHETGVVHETQGDLDGALKQYHRALELFDQLSDSDGWAIAVGTIANVHLTRSDLGTALRLFELQLETQMQVDPQGPGVANAEGSIGNVHSSLGNPMDALEHYRRAQAIFDRIAPESISAALARGNIGVTHLELGQLDAAREQFDDALRTLERIAPASVHTATFLCDMGEVLAAGGANDAAIERYQKALEILGGAAPLSPNVAHAHEGIGVLYSRQGELAAAHAHFERALRLYVRTVPGGSREAQALTNLALIDRMHGDLPAAISRLERAVQISESLRARAGGQRARERVFAESQSPYQTLIACYYERSEPRDREEAFAVAERSRARSLVELLAERHIEVAPETEEQVELLDQERQLQSRLAGTNRRLAGARQSDAPELVGEVESEERELVEELERVRDRLRQAFPAYAELEYPEPLDLTGAQAELDSETLLLEYDATGEDTFVWAVRDNAFAMRSMEAPAERLAELLDAAVGPYQAGETQGSADVSEALAELVRHLLAPVPPELWVGAKRLLIVPDGGLHYLPFEILPFEEEILGERYPIAYSPSLTAYSNLRHHTPREAEAGFLGFGDPDFGDGGREEGGEASRRFSARGVALRPLPFTRDEVDGIAENFGEGATAYLGTQATERRVKDESSGHRYLHFATHGLLDDRNPLYSGLALSPPSDADEDEDDDLLQVWEMFGLRLAADLVVCSACDTGRGMIHEGEGLVGMARALFFAGTRCVVVSLWSVPDAATSDLMQRLYLHLRSGEPVAESLRRAKAELRADRPDRADPYYWAAFVAVGLG